MTSSTYTINRSSNFVLPEAVDPQDPITRSLGQKQYELSNHLGNVLVTVSDRKLAEGTEGTTATGYKADVLFASDYYPFGMQMPGREFSEEEYRYGFNGMEKDDEWKGEGNSYDFGARMYDAKIGRWLSTDPLSNKYPNASPYSFALNSPMQAIDPNGAYVYFLNLNEANILVEDLNRLYSKRYGFEQAFSVVTVETIVKESNPEYGFLDMIGLDDDPEFIERKETRHYLLTNPEFDWTTDRYTAGVFDVLNVNSHIEIDIICDNCQEYIDYVGSAYARDGFLKDYSGGKVIDSWKIILSEDLSKYGDRNGGKTFAVTSIHELLYHLHPMGRNEGNPMYMKNTYSEPSGKDHPTGNNQNPALKDPIEKERLKEERNETKKG